MLSEKEKEMLNGKKVLVTGASRGLGLAIAGEFLKNGCQVFLNAGHDPARLEAAVRELGGNCQGVLADVADYDACQNMFAQVGPVDILVNNAGISYIGLFQDMAPKDWNRLLDTNLKGVLHCSHLAIPGMVRRKSGAILNISSIWGQEGASCEAVYSATKGGVEAFTKALAKELGPSGIRVNAIACGVMDTAMNAWLTAQEAQELRDGISLGRFGRPEEAAALAVFLADDSAAYINGQVITLDGGRY